MRAEPIANGNDGCDRTGASMMSSTIIPSANPPEKHMPTAPTPGPPTSACRLRASARNQAMIGDVWFNANRGELPGDAHLQHRRPGDVDARSAPCRACRRSDGMITVKPASTTSLANFVDQRRDARDLVDDDDAGAAPSPVGRHASMPAAVNDPSSQPASTSSATRSRQPLASRRGPIRRAPRCRP